MPPTLPPRDTRRQSFELTDLTRTAIAPGPSTELSRHASVEQDTVEQGPSSFITTPGPQYNGDEEARKDSTISQAQTVREPLSGLRLVNHDTSNTATLINTFRSSVSRIKIEEERKEEERKKKCESHRLS